MSNKHTVLRQYQAYVSPYNTELISKAMLYKQEKQDAASATIANTVNQITNMSLARDVDKEYLYSRMAGIVGSLNNEYKDADLSSDAVSRNIQLELSTAVDDKVANAYAGTLNLQRYQAQVAKAKEANNGTYSAENDEYSRQPILAWMNDENAGTQLLQVDYIPYTDTQARLNKEAKDFIAANKGKSKSVDIPLQVMTTVDGKEVPTASGVMVRRKVEEMTFDEVKTYLSTLLNPQDRQQLKIDSWSAVRRQPSFFAEENFDGFANTMKASDENSKKIYLDQAALYDKDGNPGAAAQCRQRAKLYDERIKSTTQDMARLKANYNPEEAAAYMIKNNMLNNLARSWEYTMSEEQYVKDPAVEMQNERDKLALESWVKQNEIAIEQNKLLLEQQKIEIDRFDAETKRIKAENEGSSDDGSGSSGGKGGAVRPTSIRDLSVESPEATNDYLKKIDTNEEFGKIAGEGVEKYVSAVQAVNDIFSKDEKATIDAITYLTREKDSNGNSLIPGDKLSEDNITTKDGKLTEEARSAYIDYLLKNSQAGIGISNELQNAINELRVTRSIEESHIKTVAEGAKYVNENIMPQVEGNTAQTGGVEFDPFEKDYARSKSLLEKEWGTEKMDKVRRGAKIINAMKAEGVIQYSSIDRSNINRTRKVTIANDTYMAKVYRQAFKDATGMDITDLFETEEGGVYTRKMPTSENGMTTITEEDVMLSGLNYNSEKDVAFAKNLKKTFGAGILGDAVKFAYGEGIAFSSKRDGTTKNNQAFDALYTAAGIGSITGAEKDKFTHAILAPSTQNDNMMVVTFKPETDGAGQTKTSYDPITVEVPKATIMHAFRNAKVTDFNPFLQIPSKGYESSTMPVLSISSASMSGDDIRSLVNPLLQLGGFIGADDPNVSEADIATAKAFVDKDIARRNLFSEVNNGIEALSLDGTIDVSSPESISKSEGLSMLNTIISTATDDTKNFSVKLKGKENGSGFDIMIYGKDDNGYEKRLLVVDGGDVSHVDLQAKVFSSTPSYFFYTGLRSAMLSSIKGAAAEDLTAEKISANTFSDLSELYKYCVEINNRKQEE